jgi:Flp pilus assembly secretin CpaC
MKNATSPTVRTLVMAAGIASAQHSVAFVSGEPVVETSNAAARAAATKATLDQVQSLLAVSKVVKAKEILGGLRAADMGGMSAADSGRYQELLRAVTQREKALDRNELSVQKAEVALESGELGLAEQHAKAVATAKGASAVLQRQADELLAKIDTRRETVKASAPKAIRAAANAFDLGKYTQAKELLDTVAKAGVTLDAADAAMMDDYRGRIVTLAQTRADLFAASGAAAGMVQPGEIQPRRPEEAEPLEATPSRPAAEPAVQPAEQPAPEAAPAAEAMAMAQPEAAPAPAQPPAEDPVLAARRNEAARELARADELFANRKFADASAAYNNLRANYGDVLTPEQSNALNTNAAAAQQALASMVAPAAGPAGGGQAGGLASFQDSTAVAKQQALAEFNNFLMESKRSLDKGDVEVARQNAARAELVLDSRKALFGEPELLDLRGRVNAQRAEIQKRGDAIAAEEAAKRDRTLQDDARSRSDTEKAAKAQKIRENIDRVRSLQASRKYAEGLQVVDEILFLDPLNPTGLLLRDVLRDMKLYNELGQIDDAKSRSYDLLAVENIDAATAPTSTVSYPKEWPNISGMRSEALAFQDTPDNRRVLAALDATRIPKAELADTPLEASLKYLQTFANVNMDIDWASLESIGVQKDTTVSMNLTNPTVKTVLDQVLMKVSPSTDATGMAGWTVYDGVLHIGSEISLRRNKVMVIYDVQDLLFEIRDKTDIPELDLQAAFQNTGGGGGGGGGGGSPFGGGGQGQQRQPGQGLQRPFEERIRDLRTIIVEQVDRGGWAESGGDENATIQVFQQNLIVTHTPKVHRAIEGLLSQLRRVRNMQINVEARFLVVSSDFFEQIGFDVDLYLNARSNQVRFLRQFNPAFMPSEFFPQGVYVGNNVSSGNKVVDSNNDGIPDSALAGGGPASVVPENFSVVGITAGSLPLTSRLMTSAFANEVTGSGTASPALGISGTFLDDVQVDFLLQATQADRRSVSLNAPRLTFTNGQTANVYVARQIGYIADLEAQVNEGGVAYDPQPGFVNDGVTLLVGGVILADRRYVQLDVETAVSNFPPEDIRRVPVTAATTGGGGVIGGGSGRTFEAFFELPQGQIQSVSTTVTVPDMGTVLLGGQRLTQEIEVESGVPVLGKIPFINRFFNNRSMSREERTLLMLIRPQILIQDETEDKFFPGLREAIRTGGFGS